MITVAIVTRRLKEGKTYEDFRKAWYHTTGFETANKMYTVMNAFDPREIIVIGFTETDPSQFLSQARIDVKERLNNPLEDVIEPSIGRQFGVLVSEDDFSTAGIIEYKPAAIAGKETNPEEISDMLSVIADMITRASRERDRARKDKKIPGSKDNAYP